jgi:alpha-galactosidase
LTDLRRNRVAAGALALSALLGLVLFGGAALAAQTDISIAMPVASAAPRILGPASFAARPGSAFLYTIAATGQKPLVFTASGVPSGLALASDTGTISGTMPAAGSYPLTITVSNASGSAHETFTLLSGNALAQTPPMGWNSYDSFGATVTEAEVMAAAQAQLAQLQPHGWNYVVVDYLWFDSEQATDANGRFLPSKSRFPSATGTLGFKPLADKIHALGLNFGIHIMRGVPRKSVAANSPIAGSTYTAAQAGNTSDACPWDTHMWGVHGDTAAGQAWYDSIFAQYAAWGIDFVKVDDMLDNQVTPLVYHQAEVDAIRAAIDKSGRSIVLSLSPGPMRTADATDLNGNANMWRMVNDFWDKNGLSTLADVFTAAGSWQAVPGLGVGHWPDCDMLPLGYLGPRCPVGASRATALTHNEQVSVMSLWSIMPSPLIFGGNVPMLTTDATGPLTLALLTNDEVIAVDQDSAGAKGKRISISGSQQIWSKDLSGGRKAVAFFNRGEADIQMSATLAQLGVTGPVAARDLWKRSDLPPVTTSLSVSVPWRGAALIVLSPPATDADAGVAADAGVDAGALGSGGADGSAGSSTSSGGSAGALVVTGSAGSGAAAAQGGAGVENGGASGGAMPQGDSSGASPSSAPASGCSCELGAGSSHGSANLLSAAMLGALSIAWRRRRRRIAGATNHAMS